MNKVDIRNKRATFDYELVDRLVCGIVLSGTEVKSIRAGKASISEAYCFFKKGELWVKKINVAEYSHGGVYNHITTRDRKLIARKAELNKFESKVRERGFTIIPVRLFVSERGWAKLEVALARGKKTHDKRHSIKERDMKREMDRRR